MKKFKTDVIWRLIISITYEIFSVVFIIRLFFPEPPEEIVLLLEWAPLFKYVFPSILMFSVAIYSLITMIDSIFLLANPKLIKKRFIHNTDERILLIRQKSGSKFFRVVLYIEIIITIIFGVSDPVVFAGLLMNDIILVLVYTGFRIYYSISLK